MLTPEQIAREEAEAETYHQWHLARQEFFHPSVAKQLYSREEAQRLAGPELELASDATGKGPDGLFTRNDIVRLWFVDAKRLRPSDVLNGIATNNASYLPDEITVPRALLRSVVAEINGEMWW
jgi:hypothetical protein